MNKVKKEVEYRRGKNRDGSGFKWLLSSDPSASSGRHFTIFKCFGGDRKTGGVDFPGRVYDNSFSFPGIV